MLRATPLNPPAGTACVYSKKVEYLHNLVYRALEAIAAKKHGNGAKERATGGGDAGGDNDDSSDEDTFLCLDDTLQVGGARGCWCSGAVASLIGVKALRLLRGHVLVFGRHAAGVLLLCELALQR